MGCFDEVTIRCPECGHHTLEQSKAGDCSMLVYCLEDAPAEIKVDLNGERIECEKCGYVMRIKVFEPQVVVL